MVRPPTASTPAIATRPIGTRADTTATQTGTPAKVSETTESVDLDEDR
jgi:hypothetical protein